MLLSTLAAGVAFAQAPSNDLTISAWVVFWNPDCFTRFAEQSSIVTEVMPEWIAMDSEGMPYRRVKENDVEKASFWKTAKASKTKTLAMISNFASEAGGFDAARVQKMLATKEARAKHIRQLVSIAKEDGFKGLDIDIESLHAKDKEAYSLYVEELAQATKKARLFLTVTVHPKTNDKGGWEGPEAQDYARIGKAADVVKIMCYDFSWSGSQPGPIAPDDWVEQVITYAKTVIPAKKIDMGVAGYGYDWTTKPAGSMRFDGWKDLDAEATDCPRSGERINGARYFSGAGAFARKKALAKKLGIRGLALWYLGSEDPAIWSSFKP